MCLINNTVPKGLVAYSFRVKEKTKFDLKKNSIKKIHIVLVGNALKGEGRRIELRIRISFQNLSIKEGVCRNISYLIFF